MSKGALRRAPLEPRALRRNQSGSVRRSCCSHRPCHHQVSTEWACKPDPVPRLAAGDDHSSSPTVTRGVQRPTRGLRPGQPRTPPYLVLLRVGFSLPALSPGRRCALTAPFHPCHLPRRRSAFGAPESSAVYFLWHFPWGHPRWPLTSTLPSESGLSSPALTTSRGDRPAHSADNASLASTATASKRG